MIEIKVESSCIRCGSCVSVCPAYIFQLDRKEGILTRNEQSCIACGQCVAVCPTESVTHSLIKQSDTPKINKEILPSADSLMELMRKRRSNRSFSKREVPEEYLERILEAAYLAPTARNLQPLKYVLVTDPDILNDIIENTVRVVSLIADSVKNPQNEVEKITAYYTQKIIDAHKNGIDIILRKAKAVVLIYSEDNSIADANLAYQNASLMAECLGVAHFYTGFICKFSAADINNIITAPLGIKGKILAGMGMGMPRSKFDKTVIRKTPTTTRF